MTEKLYTQSELDALIQAANEAALREAGEKLDGEECLSSCNSVMHDDLCPYVNPGNFVRSLIPEPSALARHDAELRAEFQDEIQALNEQIVQMKAEFAAVMNDTADAVFSKLMKLDCDHRNIAYETIIEAIPTDYASALDRRLAEERLEEAEWWVPLVPNGVSVELERKRDNHLAELRRAVQPEVKP